jgi:RNA polymerase sigma factor (sigma-70 family)
MYQPLDTLWNRVTADESKAWEELVRRYNTLVIAVARAHGLAAADLEDCAQQTWLALYLGRKRIKDPLKIPTWLVRVAKRKAQKIQLKAKSRLSAEGHFEGSSQTASPEELYLQALEAARIQTALELLDPRCRQLLARLFLSDEDWSYRQIARDLGLAANSLGPIRSRCLLRLKRILEELDPDLY